MTLPELSRNQWIMVGVLAIIALLISFKFTNWWEGEAIEISVENAGSKPIFAHIDNTGRHSRSTIVEKLETTDGKQTPSGLLIKPLQTRSFGTAVGLGDSPTLHISPVTDNLRVDLGMTNDCAFDTISFKKIEIPSRHVKIKWTGDRCEILK